MSVLNRIIQVSLASLMLQTASAESLPASSSEEKGVPENTALEAALSEEGLDPFITPKAITPKAVIPKVLTPNVVTPKEQPKPVKEAVNTESAPAKEERESTLDEQRSNQQTSDKPTPAKQARKTSSDKEDMGTVTVEGKSEAAILTHSPMPVSVIDATRFHGRNISLNEVLKRVAGVRLAQEGGLGSRSTIAIHGLEGKRVKIFIDGSPLNSPDGSFGINEIPIQLIERIEIYKGVVPARFGGDALGGAVNVVVREFDGTWVDLNYSLGSFDTHRAAVVLTKYWDEHKAELGVGGFYNSAANDYMMKSPFVEGLNIKRDHDAFESFVYAVGGKLEDRPWFDKIGFELIRYESEKEIQGIQTNIQQARSKSSINILGINYDKDGFFLDRLDLKYNFIRPELTLNFIDKAEECFSSDGSSRPCPGVGGEISGIPHDSADQQDELRHDLNLHYSLNRNHGLNFHFNSQFSEFKPHDPLASAELGYDTGAFPSERTNTVSTLSYESAFMQDKIANDMGIKQYDYDYTITAQERTLSGTPEQTKTTGSEFGWYESIRYSPLKDLYFKASYEHAFRLPDSSEIFGDGVAITTSSTLQPEEGKNLNLGVLFDRFDFYGMPWFKAEATYFHRDLQNMIKLVPAFQVLKYENLGEISVEGFELEVKADLNDAWYLYANYTHQTLKDEQRFMTGTRSTPNPTFGLDVPNVPRQFANLGLEYKTFGLFRDDAMMKYFWESTWMDEYFFGWELSRFQNRRIEAQTSHTAGFEYSFHDDEIIVGFEVRNLTDEDITDVFNFPLPGRSWHLNLRYSWFD